jgi:hypothetical protein
LKAEHRHKHFPLLSFSEKLHFPSFDEPDASRMLCKRVAADGLELSETAVDGLPDLMKQV